MNNLPLNMELFEDGPVVVFIWKNQPGWPVELVTNNLLNIYGHEPSEYLNGKLHYIDQVHPDDIALVSEEVTAASENSKTKSFIHKPYRYLDGSGKYRWVKDSSQIIRSENGDITHYIGYLIDISDEIELQEETNRLKERLDLAWSGINDGLWDWEIERNSVYFSPRWKEMIGYGPNEFPNDSDAFFKAIHPEDQPRVEKLLKRHFSDPKNIPYEIDIRIRSKNGEYKWIRTRGKTTLNSDGTPHRMVGAHTDINENKQQNESIELLQRRYASMFHKHDSIMLLFNPTSGAVVDANESAIKFYGYSRDEFLSLNIWDINILPRNEIALRMQATLKREKNQFIFEHKLKNGNIRTIEVFGSPIDTENGKLIFSIIRDITQAKENEEKLKKLSFQNQADKQRYQALMEFSSDGIFVMDMDGNLKECSQMAANMLGYSMDEMTRLDVYDWDVMIPPDTIRELFHSISTEKSLNFETKYKRKDGSTYDAALSVIKIIINEESLVYASVRDITHQKQIKKELQEKNQDLEKTQLKFQTLFEESLDGIVLMDPKTQKFIEFNHHAYEMYGYSKEEFGFLTPKDLDAIKNEEQILSTQQAIIKKGWDQFTTKHKAKNGTLKDIVVSVKVFTIDDSSVLHATFHDITEQNKRAKLIKKQNEEFKTVFETTKDGLAIIDLQSNFISFNGAYLSMTGFSHDELLQKSCLELSIPEDIERAKEALAEVLIKGSITNFEKSCFQKDGSIITLNIAIALMHDKKHFLLSTKDVTESKQLRNDLVFAKEHAEKADKAKSEFLANMSHEIRTPLNGIIGLNTLMQKTPLNEQQSDYVRKSLQSSKALLGVINDILDYSKIEAGKLELSMQTFNLEELLQSTSDLFEYTLEQKGVKIHIDIDDSLPNRLEGDSLRLSQILNNLVGNSVKFTPSGDITIKSKVLTQDDDSVKIAFSISDTGIGMSEEEQKKLFKSFTQADASTTRKYGGTGLGLVISKQLVEMMGGTIWAQSTQGEGTTLYFTIVLKIAKKLKLQEMMQQSHTNDLDNVQFEGKILLVEDNKVNQLVASMLLDDMGLEVDIANDGSQAVEKSVSGDYNLILMDLQMPVMDGFTAAKNIRTFNASIPIIALSAAVMEKDKQLTKEAGMNEHIAKPIDIRELQNLLARYLKRVD